MRRLRGRLALRTAALLAPILVVLLIVQLRREWRASELELGASVMERMLPARAACERDASTFGLAVRDDAVLHAYAADGRSANPRAAPLDRELARRARPGVAAAGWDLTRGVAVVAMPWSDGPCALVQLSYGGAIPRGPVRVVGVTIVRVAVVASIVALAVAVAVGPIVRRLRRLAGAVARRAAAAGHPPTDESRDEIDVLADVVDVALRHADRELSARKAREAALEEHLASSAHDLAIPLTVLQGELATMKAASDRGQPASPDVVRRAIGEAHYAGAIVADLGVTARERAGMLGAGARQDLRAILEQVVTRHRTLAAARGVTVEWAAPEIEVPVVLDATAAQQAIGNVVLNAVQYAREFVGVVLDLTPEGWTVRVEDDGPGLAQGETFESLAAGGTRGHVGAHRRPEGTGVGLAVTRRVARLYAWTIEADAAVPEGGLVVTLRGARSAS
ncbi:MAG: HAMP domain-containing histidine kinase [Deltaproteobacteria bacterium]|nr:HAMP domain-containing histidine kinase [Deltaproteobacteria bacterium]